MSPAHWDGVEKYLAWPHSINGVCLLPTLSTLPSVGIVEHFAAWHAAGTPGSQHCGGRPQALTGAGDQWVKRDSVSAVPNFLLSSSLHSSPDAWLSNFSIM